jgi:pimeloyl-ACP methyl ester carboxylesterase
MTISKIAAVATIAVVLGMQAFVESSADSDAPHNQRLPQEEGIAATPSPYREELVAFDNPAAAGVRLAGTLTLPQGAGPFPAVVLISGSGPNGRDEEQAGHKLALVMADALTRDGCAVLRYDKRGVDKSTGDYSAATTLDFASDARAAVSYVRGRSDIVRAKVGLIGHSEGGTIAAIVAAKDPSLAFIVMMAAFSIPGKVLVAEQTRRIAIADGQAQAMATQTYNLNRRLYDAIAASKDQSDAEARVRKILAATKPAPDKDEVDQAILFTKLPAMRFILAFDPAQILSEIHVPVLALYGSKDLVVPTDLNLPVLRETLTHDKDVTIKEMPGLNHLFQHAKTGSPREFEKIQETLSPEVLVLISKWVAQHTSAAKSDRIADHIGI